MSDLPLPGVTADTLLTQILMMRAAEHAFVLAVEGLDDVALLRPHVNTESVFLMDAGGSPNVVGLLQRAEVEGVPDVVGLLDRDWVGIADEGSETGREVYTDRYDLHSTIYFAEDVASRVVHAVGSAAIDRHGVALVDAALASAFAFATAVGAVRLADHELEEGLSLRHLPHEKVVAFSSQSVDEESVVRAALSKMPPASLSTGLTELVDRAVRLRDMVEPEDLCCGHDLAAALAAGLRERGVKSLGKTQVEAALRAACSREVLMSCKFFEGLCQLAGGTRLWAFEV